MAIKVDTSESGYYALINENQTYRCLQGGAGIPRLHWYGVDGDCNYLVVELLDPSLGNLFKFCDYKFSVKTTLLLADMVSRLELLHGRNYVHRDIQPGNFAMGLGMHSKST